MSTTNMPSQCVASPAELSQPCLLVKRRHQRKKSSSPSRSALCTALFFASIFSPLTTDELPRHLSKSSPAIDHDRKQHGLKFPAPHAVQAFSSPLPATKSTLLHYGQSRIGSRLFSSTAEVSGSTISARRDLEKMTVKQLKAHIQDSGIQIPRGEASNLKLKKQIVDFIWSHESVNGLAAAADDHHHANGVNGELSREEVNHVPKSSTTAKKRKVGKLSVGTGMPPLPTTPAKNGGDDSSPYVLSPKDRIVLDVLDRYPPLHESILDACVGHEDGLISELPLQGITADNIEHCDLTAINYVVPNRIGDEDVRHLYHPMMVNTTQSDMDIVFIGTASCTPGVTRGVSCTALRLNWRSSRTYDNNQQPKSRGERKRSGTYVEERGPTGGTWLFDCGESTQLSIQKTPSVKPGKISKIFITHCHGDHSFGLPGLLCLAGTDRTRDDPPVEIYGPEGLRMWLRVAIRYSVSRVVPPYRVHELMDVPMAPEWEEGHRRNGRFYFQLKKDYARENGGGKGGRWRMQGLAGEDPNSWISRAPMINLEASKDFGEMDGGRDIFPDYDHPQSSDGAPVWEVHSDDDVSVRAAPMSHSVPCVGYVVAERDQPGRLKPENVLPIVERNREGLIESGVRNPMKVMAMVKNLEVGGQYVFPDGTVVRQEDVVEPPRRGRKVVICGDTANCRSMEALGQDANVVIHEATNTFLKGIDKDTSFKATSRDAKIHGHSTPIMAGEFAKRINAKKLVMNHFSARYKGDQSVESMTIMTRMERQAMAASGLPEDSVAAAWDFMVLPVARNG